MRNRFLLLILVLAATFTRVAFAQAPVIADYSGNGLSNTRPFTASSGWEIQWSASGDIFQIYVHDISGDLIDVAANQMGPGNGSSYQAPAGTFYLQVNAIGSWSVRVVQVQEMAHVSTHKEFTGNGTQSTRPFRVDGPWEIQWDAKGDLFQVYLYTATGDLVDVAANQLGAGAGTSYQPRAGTYYFQVNGMGTWTVRVERLN